MPRVTEEKDIMGVMLWVLTAALAVGLAAGHRAGGVHLEPVRLPSRDPRTRGAGRRRGP